MGPSNRKKSKIKKTKASKEDKGAQQEKTNKQANKNTAENKRKFAIVNILREIIRHYTHKTSTVCFDKGTIDEQEKDFLKLST